MLFLYNISFVLKRIFFKKLNTAFDLVSAVPVDRPGRPIWPGIRPGRPTRSTDIAWNRNQFSARSWSTDAVDRLKPSLLSVSTDRPAQSTGSRVNYFFTQLYNNPNPIFPHLFLPPSPTPFLLSFLNPKPIPTYLYLSQPPISSTKIWENWFQAPDLLFLFGISLYFQGIIVGLEAFHSSFDDD